MNYQRNCGCCGKVVIFPENSLTHTCAACGTLNDIIRAEGPVLDSFRHADSLRELGDFDGAAESYRRVLDACPEEYEAYWALALCKYHIVHEEDRATGRWLPALGRLQKHPFREDADFQQACRLAPPKKREQLMAEAELIDGVIAQVRALMAEQEPYDVFLCGSASGRARDLYQLLSREGYRVFLAGEEAERFPAETAPEAACFFALNSARLMLAPAASETDLNASPAQGQWKRYLALLSGDEGRLLLPLLYGDMQEEALPQSMRNWKLETLEMTGAGASDALLQRVRRHLGEPAYPDCGEERFTSIAAEGGCIITGYTGSSLRLRIPQRLQGRPVIGVGQNAFFGQGRLREVLLPANLRLIGAQAFGGCSGLTKLTIPAGVRSIGDRALMGCSGLKELTLPVSLTSLGDKALMGCSGLTALSLPGSLTHMGERALMGCSGLRLVTLPPALPCVSEGMLMCCTSLTGATLPGGLQSIGRGAFLGCTALTGLTIPATVGSIGPDAFCGCTALTLQGVEGSEAMRFAAANDIPFRPVRC